MPPRGISNLGQTCYLNTALQCLFNCDLFRHYVLTLPGDNHMVRCLRDVFGELMTSAISSPVTPYKFVDHLSKDLASLIEVREQNDLCEFYALFMDKLNAALSTKLDIITKEEFYEKNRHIYNMNSPLSRLSFKAEYEWIKSNAREWSSLLNISYGQIISQMECGNCHKIYHNFEPFNTLSLSIPAAPEDATAPAPTLACALDAHFGSHKISGWKCDNCSQTHTSIQTSTMWRAPPVLMVSLKRFDHQRDSVYIKKNNSRVDIPQDLDISKWIIPHTPGIQTCYKLKGVGYHIGSYYGGHYFSVIISSGKVFQIDDESVREIAAEDLERNIGYGYAFFYERV